MTLNNHPPRRSQRSHHRLALALIPLLFAGTGAVLAADGSESKERVEKRSERIVVKRSDRRHESGRRSRANATKPHRGDRYNDSRRHNGRRGDRHGSHYGHLRQRSHHSSPSYRYNDRHRRDHYYDGRYGRHDGHTSHYRRYGRHGYRGHRFEVPRVIVHTDVHLYEPYYYGRSYYHDHSHYHTIYRFPVYVEGHLEYRPYAYCDGSYFAVGIFTDHGPDFSISIHF